jgi:peptidoglycan hydrolase-like protein with peptidoglycan-binding domain
MFIASKIVWGGITLTLLTTGLLAPCLPRSAPGSDSPKEKVAVFVVKNEIKKVQDTLRNKGHYVGQVDGVFGLRTRASIRAYQKAESLPITGQVDTRTAAGLGVRPESNWDNSQSTGRQVGHSSDIVVGEIRREKPSAGIKRGEGRASKISRREVSRATALEDNRRGGANKQQGENDSHDQ